jgi:ubiquinol-cytochrome c reductase cytochrome c subunit
MRRIGLVLLAVAFAGLLNVAIAIAQDDEPASVAPDPDLVRQGADLFQLHCALCHGTQGRGLEGPGPSGGPSLVGVGPASVDFMVRTGRMPMQDQRDPLRRGPSDFSETERAALVAFVSSLAPGEGPEIPDVGGWPEADLSAGLAQFTTNCAACHGPTAAGIAVGQNDVSSDLSVAEPIEIAEAIRTGPGVMPVFDDDVMPVDELEATVAWVMHLREREAPGGVSVGRSGPVSEGAVAWIVGLGLLGVVMYLLGERSAEAEPTTPVDDDPAPGTSGGPGVERQDDA